VTGGPSRQSRECRADGKKIPEKKEQLFLRDKRLSLSSAGVKDKKKFKSLTQVKKEQREERGDGRSSKVARA